MKECVKEKHQLFHCQDVQKEQVRKRLKENNDLSNDLGLKNLEFYLVNCVSLLFCELENHFSGLCSMNE